METQKQTNQIVNAENSVAPTESPAVVTGARKLGRPKTKMHLTRCILANGIPLGKGRPTKEEMAAPRTVVYLAEGAKYSPSIHGLGEPLDKRKHKSFKVVPLQKA